MKTVCITGIGGQDGSYLAELYLEMEGYKVIGIDRWSPTGVSVNLAHIIDNENLIIENGDITEPAFIHRVFEKYKPDYWYNLAAISLVPESFKIPQKFLEINTMAVLNMLEEIRTYSPHTRFYQASSSEQIGKNTDVPQNEDSKMIPNSPYAIAKLASFHYVRLYRESFGLYAVNGLLWNHEGPRRGPDFVTRKISMAVAKIKNGGQEFVSLGNLDAKRDWGSSKDYCEAMMMMVHSGKPDDYGVSTGESHSVRDFVEHAFECIGEKITWKGDGIYEVGLNQEGKVRVKIDEQFYRPADVPHLCGDYSKIERELGWKPRTKFKELVRIMVENDIKLLNQ